MTKHDIAAQAIKYQRTGFGILLFFIIGDEVFDLPHKFFGVPATPVNWVEVLIEGSIIVLLATMTMNITRKFLGRIKILEGFLPICSFCKKIRREEDWISLESYVGEHCEALFTHGLCPECAKIHYGTDLNQETD